jgi:hypothetical protein
MTIMFAVDVQRETQLDNSVAIRPTYKSISYDTYRKYL